MTGAALITAVLDQGGFDVAQAPRTMVLGWINELVDELVVRSRWRRDNTVTQVTVAGQSRYTVGPAIVEMDEMTVGGVTASRVTTEQLWKFRSGELILRQGAIVFAPFYDTAAPGTEGVEIYPTPSTAGLVILMTQSLSAATEVADTTDPVTVVPSDVHGRVVDEAIRLGRFRLYGVEQDGAAREGLVNLLRERRNSRLGGGTQQLVVLRRRRG